MTTFFENYVFKKEKPLFFFKEMEPSNVCNALLIVYPRHQWVYEACFISSMFLTGKQITYELLSGSNQPQCT